MHKKQLVLVIAPTLALMYDQALNLSTKGVPAITFGSNGENTDVLSRYTGGCVVYLTAEHLYGPTGECNRRLSVFAAIGWMKLTYFLNGSTSGSVHTLCCYRSSSVMCVVCWYRPSFKSLKRISIEFPNIPVIALTATAPPM